MRDMMATLSCNNTQIYTRKGIYYAINWKEMNKSNKRKEY